MIDVPVEEFVFVADERLDIDRGQAVDRRVYLRRVPAIRVSCP